MSANVPHADAFPLTVPRAASTSSSPFSWLWRIFGGGAGRRDDATTHIEVPHDPHPDDGGVNLSTALQYGPATGLPRTQEFIHEFTERVYAPAYHDWTTLIHTGNTDGYVCRPHRRRARVAESKLGRRWSRISRMLLNPGDTLLVEEWTYPSALAGARPIDLRLRAVPMDSQGMRADALREILAGWDVEKDGTR